MLTKQSHFVMMKLEDEQMKVEEREQQDTITPKPLGFHKPSTVWLRYPVFNLVKLYAKDHGMTIQSALEELVKAGLFTKFQVKLPPED